MSVKLINIVLLLIPNYQLKYKTIINVFLYIIFSGKSYTKRYGLYLSEFKRTKYNPLLMPQLSIEFAGGAFRVPHNVVASLYK